MYQLFANILELKEKHDNNPNGEHNSNESERLVSWTELKVVKTKTCHE